MDRSLPILPEVRAKMGKVPGCIGPHNIDSSFVIEKIVWVRGKKHRRKTKLYLVHDICLSTNG